MHKIPMVVICVVLPVWTSGVLADAQSDFQSLFGDEIKRLRNGKEAAVLAGRMLLAVGSIKDRADLDVLLWTRAAEFGAKAPSGFTTATKALRHLLRAAPDDSSRWIAKLSAIHKRRYALAGGAERAKVGAELVAELITIGDAQIDAQRSREAMVIYRRALSIATLIKSIRKTEILEKIKIANAMVTAQREVERLKLSLANDPDDTKTRTAIVQLHLLELDNPGQAAKLLGDDLDEKLRTYVLLAAKNIGDLEAGVCLELGQWYWEMFPTARNSRTKIVVLRRTSTYLERFSSLHTTTDTSKLRAAIILRQVDAELLKLASKGLAVLIKPVIIADFESPRLVGWKMTGRAFGKGPCEGKPLSHSSARGFEGKLMISSYHEGDGSKGMLMSPKFIIRGKTITFLVGGGECPGEACMNLIVGDKVVRTVTGHTSNRLRPDGWDVSDLVGQTAQLQVIDTTWAGWGHILIDHIVQHPGRINEVLKR